MRAHAAPADSGASDGGAAILVTGASGLLGSYLVRALEPMRDAVTFAGLTRVPAGDDRWVTCDLTDARQVEGLIAARRPRLVVHAAALTNVDLCETDPGLAEAVNRDAAACVARLTSEAGGRFVFISTDSVFDGLRGNYAETDEPAPVNGYARSKLEGEREVAAAAANHLVLRTNFFGRSDRGSGLADWLLRELGAGRPVVGFGDVIFSPLHAATLAELTLELARSDLRGTLHLGASDAVSKLEFARLVAQAYGLDTGLVRAGRLADAALDAPRPLDTSLDTRAAAARLGRPLPAVAMGVARMRSGDA